MEYYVTIGRSKLELHDLKWMNLENKSWVKLMFEIGYLSGDEDVGRKKILLNWGTKIIQLASWKNNKKNVCQILTFSISEW